MRQKENNETKTHKNNRTWSPFVWVSCYWAACLGGMMCIPRDTPLRKSGFLFASRCQLQITSWAGLGLHVSFLFRLLHVPCCDCVCSEPVQALNMMSALL